MGQYGNPNIKVIYGHVTDYKNCPWNKYKIEEKPCVKCIKKFECNVKGQRITANMKEEPVIIEQAIEPVKEPEKKKKKLKDFFKK